MQPAISRFVPLLLVLFTVVAVPRAVCAAASEPMLLWPGEVPGEKGDIGEEKDTSKPNAGLVSGKTVIRLGNVSKPMLTVFRPPQDKDTGASVLVCPGGGYGILAYDLEGTEVCEWLNSIGVTGVLLKYRVPARKGVEKYTAALQDAQRALGVIRAHAKEWNLDPSRVGILGFSAGGHLSAMASTAYETRAYTAVDDADKESCRPDFAILIYPAWLTTKEDLMKLSPEVKVTDKTSPAFIVMAQDDPIKVESAIGYGLALKNAKVSAELHIYPKGGHGYGLRPSANDVCHWPDRAAEWMKTQGWLAAKK